MVASALTITVLAFAGCDATDREVRRPVDGDPDSVGRTTAPMAVDPDLHGLARSRTGRIFDPHAVRRGDSVGTLVIDRVAVARVTPDSIAVGTAVFSGEVELTGATIRHHEHPDVQVTCFEADSASAVRLPRWKDDRRRAWFCLGNVAEAARHLAPPGVVRSAAIVIDSFTIHRGLSDEVNTARLVRVIAVDSTE